MDENREGEMVRGKYGGCVGREEEKNIGAVRVRVVSGSREKMGRHQNNGKQKTKKNEEREEGRLESAGDDLGVWVRERERERVDGVVGEGRKREKGDGKKRRKIYIYKK